jgi:hypothetical protein
LRFKPHPNILKPDHQVSLSAKQTPYTLKVRRWKEQNEGLSDFVLARELSGAKSENKKKSPKSKC